MNLIRCLHIGDDTEASHRMAETETDAAGIHSLRSRALHFTLKIERMDPQTASLLTQEMHLLGGASALNGRDQERRAESTDVLLMGTQEQFEELNARLVEHSRLRPLSSLLTETLKNISKKKHSIRCRKRTFPLGERTLLMGILNITPDSFSDGGLYFDREKAIAQGVSMAEDGADILDIGGESTRPGSKPLAFEEELRRVIPVIESLVKKVDIPVSIDTYKSSVAQRAIEAGAEMINDISGLNFDPGLAHVAAREDLPLVLMHTRGTPETMQKDVHYESLFSEILLYLRESIRRAESAGVNPDQIIIDPGVGFGKTLEHNLLIIKNLSEFSIFGKPILLGTSRKNFIGRILNADTAHRLEGTLSSLAIAVFNGAHIIRCHDVLQARKTIAVADAIRLAE